MEDRPYKEVADFLFYEKGGPTMNEGYVVKWTCPECGFSWQRHGVIDLKCLQEDGRVMAEHHLRRSLRRSAICSVAQRHQQEIKEDK